MLYAESCIEFANQNLIINYPLDSPSEPDWRNGEMGVPGVGTGGSWKQVPLTPVRGGLGGGMSSRSKNFKVSSPVHVIHNLHGAHATFSGCHVYNVRTMSDYVPSTEPIVMHMSFYVQFCTVYCH